MDVSPELFVERLLADEAHEEPGDDGKASDLHMELPTWYDERKFKTGQKFFWDNLYGQVGGMISGLITIIAIPSILEVLVHTKRSSSIYTAYRRYVSTIMHIVSWHKHELKPGSELWKSLKTVRTRHLQAGKNARTLGIGTVSQRDIALTQWGFVAYITLKPDNLGIQALDQDAWEGFNHFWRTCLHLLGLKDKYNLCIGTVEETREVCRILMSRVFAPLIEYPPEHLEHMAWVILDSLWSVLPLSDPRSVWYLTKRMAEVPGYVFTEQERIQFRGKLRRGEITDVTKPVKKGWHDPQPRRAFNPDDFQLLSTVPEYKKLTYYERLNMHTIVFFANFYTTYIGRALLNGALRLLIFFTEYFPILAFHRFGYSNSFVDHYVESIGDHTKPMSNKEVLAMYERPPWYVRWNPIH